MPIVAVSMKYLNTYHKMLSRLATVFTVGMLVFFGWNLATGLAGAESQQGQPGKTLLTIHDGSQERGIITDASTLREALEKAGIKLDANDITEPALDDQLVATQYQVNIYRARPVIVNDAGKSTKVMSPYRTAQQIAKQANIVLQPEDKTDFSYSSDVAMVGPVEVMEIDRATFVNFVFYGKPTVTYTQAITVGEMLKSKGIELRADDTLSLPADTPITDGITVELWHNGTQTVTVEEVIDFPVEKIQDANREVGYREVKTAGVKGSRNVTYEIDYRNGKERSRAELNSVVITEPQKQIEIIGIKINLPPGSHTDWMAAAGIAHADYGYVDYIVGRESGWSPTKYNYAGSGAYGLCQSLPASKMSSAGSDYMTNPITQLKWCNSYAIGRYGSWASAYAFWIDKHWW